jgi:hypothetical protein
MSSSPMNTVVSSYLNDSENIAVRIAPPALRHRIKGGALACLLVAAWLFPTAHSLIATYAALSKPQ